MDNLHQRKKVSDGIRRSKIRKKVINTETSRSFDVEKINAKENHIDISRKVIKKKITKEKQDFIINDYQENYINKKTSFFKNFFRFLRKKKRLLKNIIFILLYCYFLFFIFNKLENTKITLAPKTEVIEGIESIKSYIAPEYDQLGFSIIMLSDSRKKNIKASEKITVSDKASGKITIFNNYSTESQRLSPETRFESVSGKIFKIPDGWVEIPGKTDKGPGSIDVIIYAEKTGPEYNIDITDFTVPGFKEAGLTAKYNDIYALSLKPFLGGFDGERLVIGDEQKKEVITNLENELKEILIKKLDIEKTDRVILIDNSVQILFKEPIVGEEKSEESAIQQEAQIFALIVEKKHLENFLRKKYLPNVNKDDVYLLSSDNINFNYSGEEIDFKNLKSVNVEMSVNGIFEWKINKDLVIESLLGLEKKYISTILREFEEVDSATIKIQPFWQKHVSTDINNINISE